MKKNILIISLIVILIAVATLAYILSQNYSSTGSPTPSTTTSTTPSPTTSQPIEKSSQTISIKNSSFNPATLTIKKGSTVSWINEDSIQHSIKFSTIQSPILNQNQTYSTNFTETGTFDYTCGIHPNMTGKIIVE